MCFPCSRNSCVVVHRRGSRDSWRMHFGWGEGELGQRCTADALLASRPICLCSQLGSARFCCAERQGFAVQSEGSCGVQACPSHNPAARPDVDSCSVCMALLTLVMLFLTSAAVATAAPCFLFASLCPPLCRAEGTQAASHLEVRVLHRLCPGGISGGVWPLVVAAAQPAQHSSAGSCLQQQQQPCAGTLFYGRVTAPQQQQTCACGCATMMIQLAAVCFVIVTHTESNVGALCRCGVGVLAMFLSCQLKTATSVCTK